MPPNLTPREIQVLQAIAHGRSTAEIGAEFHISPLTVRTHRRNLLHRLDAHTMPEALFRFLSQEMVRTRHAG